MDFSKVSYEDVEAKAADLSTTASSMDSTLQEIKMLFNQVGDDSVWSGTAASQTKSTFDMLSAQFHQFNEAVQNCSEYLVKAVETYKSVDSAISGK